MLNIYRAAFLLLKCFIKTDKHSIFIQFIKRFFPNCESPPASVNTADTKKINLDSLGFGFSEKRKDSKKAKKRKKNNCVILQQIESCEEQ